MADYSGFTVNVLDNCLVSPPPDSVPTTHLPLSFFDILWVRHPPTRRLFFYKFPHSPTHFTQTILPSLKKSLSQTLQQFFPFSANLILPPPPHKPHLLYTPHDSAVHLTIAESPDSSHFHSLIPDHPKDARDVYQLFQDWPEPRVLSDGITQSLPLLTLQITIFPNEGLSIGAAFLHVAADGPSLHHFIKSWSSLSARKVLHGPLPFHDRTVIPDPHGFESTLLQLHWSVAAGAGPINFETMPIIRQRLSDKVRATFSLSKSQIEGLKKWANSQIIETDESPHFSSFVVICSLVWVCLVASREFSDEESCCFAFVADCRNRRLGNSIPPGYFGNCLAFCYAVVKKSELLGGNGMILGMNAIGKRVGEVENEPLKDTGGGWSVWKKHVESGVAVAVAGSPRLGAYDADFGWGWGRPVKTEVVQIDNGRLFSIGESRDQKAGIEVGLALSSPHMARFLAVWEQHLKEMIDADKCV